MLNVGKDSSAPKLVCTAISAKRRSSVGLRKGLVQEGSQLRRGFRDVIGEAVLGTIDGQLADGKFLAGSEVTIADLANYAYIAHAPEGGVSLAPYANVRAWLARIESLPGFVGMTRTAVGLAA